MSPNLLELNKNLKRWRLDPALFFREVLGCEPEPYQVEMCRRIAHNQRVAIAACHDVGKSWTLARIVIWYMVCHPQCKVVTTAPTWNQVKNILWSEIRSAVAKSKVKLGGVLNQTEWQMSPDGDWFAIGFTPRNEVTGSEGQGTQSSFQGFHAPGGILVVFDEATGILPNIWTMAEGLLTQSNVKFVAIGNPTSRNSDFCKCFSDPMWEKIYLSYLDSPNVLANGIKSDEDLLKEFERIRVLPDAEFRQALLDYVSPKPHLLSLSWVMASLRKWGFTHPLFLSKVRGKFPEEGDDVLMPLSSVEEAQRRTYDPNVSDRRVIGVDVARFGMDDSVLTYVHGYKFVAKKRFSKRDTMEISGLVIAMCREFEWPDVICIDETGLGAGVVDRLRELQRERVIPWNVEIRGVQFGEGIDCSSEMCAEQGHKECDKAKYVNKKARMFDLLARDLKHGTCLPMEDIYLEELPTILYRYDSKGRLKIESKDEYKKRTSRKSPDDADSLALANYGRYDDLRIGSLSEALNETDSVPLSAEMSEENW